MHIKLTVYILSVNICILINTGASHMTTIYGYLLQYHVTFWWEANNAWSSYMQLAGVALLECMQNGKAALVLTYEAQISNIFFIF